MTENWGIDERQANRYITEAFELFKKEVLIELEENRAFHLKARMESYKELVNERAKVIKNRTLEAYKRVQMIAMLTNQINAILRDMAKIGGLYVDKIDHTTNGKSIKPTIEILIEPSSKNIAITKPPIVIATNMGQIEKAVESENQNNT